MSKFITVEKAPNEIRRGEHVIYYGNFMNEISAIMNRSGYRKVKLTSPDLLKTIVAEIVQKYKQDEIALTLCPYHRYDGLQFNTKNELLIIVVDMLLKHAPQVLEAYLDYAIKNRPFETKVIYFIGSDLNANLFYRHGIDPIKEKDIDAELGIKKKDKNNSESSETK